MNHSLRLIPASVMSAIALAACGTSHSPAVPSLGGDSHTQASASSGDLPAWRAAVTCARQHGMPQVPDPVVGANGQIAVPGYAAADLTPAVQSACAAQLRALEANGSAHPLESASDIQALLRFAACMRTHGLPRWPDPNERGEFHVKSADAGTRVQNEPASASCNSLLPPSGAYITVTPSGQ
jgi:hypothetical protein